MPFFDSHCHLDYLKTVSPSLAVHSAQMAGVDKILTVAVETQNQNTVVQLTEEFPGVYGTQGVHPHEARHFDERTEEIIRQNTTHPKILAIGEIGLDYHYHHSPADIQRQVFERQLQLAAELNKPVVVHTREAEKDTKSILQNFSKLKKIELHCFTGTVGFAKWCVQRDYYLGFNGILTFKGAQDLRDILRNIPQERILLETDAPFLAPVPHRGKENVPAYLPLVAQAMAKILGVPLAELTAQLWENGENFFFKN
jgi:TatD DNase family protein